MTTLPADELVERLRALNPWREMDWPERCREAADLISSLQKDLAERTKERDVFASFHGDRTDLVVKLTAATARADTLARRVEGLEELVQKAFKDGILYGTNVDVSDVWQAWLSSKVREELAALTGERP